MDFKNVEDSIKEIVWLPTLSYQEKIERLLLVADIVYQMGYKQGRDDTKEEVLKTLYNIF